MYLRDNWYAAALSSEDGIDRFLEKMQTGVVQEDVDAFNVLQSRVSEKRDISEVSVKIDRGGLAAHRVLAAMRDEAGATGGPQASP